jgi:hypothetical protein
LHKECHGLLSSHTSRYKEWAEQMEMIRIYSTYGEKKIHGMTLKFENLMEGIYLEDYWCLEG